MQNNRMVVGGSAGRIKVQWKYRQDNRTVEVEAELGQWKWRQNNKTVEVQAELGQWKWRETHWQLDILREGHGGHVEPTLAVQTRPPVDTERGHAAGVTRTAVRRHGLNAHRDLLQKQKQKLSCLTSRGVPAYHPEQAALLQTARAADRSEKR